MAVTTSLNEEYPPFCLSRQLTLQFLYFLVLVDFLKNTWKGLRDNYKRCLTTRLRQQRLGTSSQKLSMGKYFQQLDFLSEKISNKETISNISIETNLSDNYGTPLSPIASPRILPLPTLDKSFG